MPLQKISAFEAATPNTLEKLGNHIINSQDTRLVVDVITMILTKSQEGGYELSVKSEHGPTEPHVLSMNGLGCGLLIDWMSELQPDTLGLNPHAQVGLITDLLTSETYVE